MGQELKLLEKDVEDEKNVLPSFWWPQGREQWEDAEAMCPAAVQNPAECWGSHAMVKQEHYLAH